MATLNEQKAAAQLEPSVEAIENETKDSREIAEGTEPTSEVSMRLNLLGKLIIPPTAH